MSSNACDVCGGPADAFELQPDDTPFSYLCGGCHDALHVGPTVEDYVLAQQQAQQRTEA